MDFAPLEVVPCKDGERIVLPERLVASASAGIVRVIGNDNDRNDKNHSVVMVESPSGIIFAYTHIANPNKNIAVGKKIFSGQPLGDPSCEHPPGGRITGLHVHFAVYDRNFNPIPIDGLKLSGFTVVAGENVGEGILVRQGEEIRTADQRRCDEKRICLNKDGKRIRNDLWPLGEILRP